VLDTHISLAPNVAVTHRGREYAGHRKREHDPRDDQKTKLGRLHSSLGNDASIWLTRPSLINALGLAGLSSLCECFHPVHLGYERDCDGLDPILRDRCTFVALKGTPVRLQMLPAANEMNRLWPEESLDYGGVHVNLEPAAGQVPPLPALRATLSPRLRGERVGGEGGVRRRHGLQTRLNAALSTAFRHSLASSAAGDPDARNKGSDGSSPFLSGDALARLEPVRRQGAVTDRCSGGSICVGLDDEEDA
jgi:hypothetical protein